jgi:hypothetical protein
MTLGQPHSVREYSISNDRETERSDGIHVGCGEVTGTLLAAITEHENL